MFLSLNSKVNMAGSVVGFDTWLSEKLLFINKDVDLDVFVEYIMGILETDTSRDDKNESLEGIIGEILVCVLRPYIGTVENHGKNGKKRGTLL